MRFLASREPAGLESFDRQWLFNDATAHAASHGDMESLAWLTESYLPAMFLTKAVTAAADSGQLDVLKWLHANLYERCNWGSTELCNAIRNKHGDVIEWLQRTVVPQEQCRAEIMAEAAKCGNLGVVKWLRIDYHVDADEAKTFAEQYGHSDVVQWIITHCDVTNWYVDFDAAAANGSLELLQWAADRVLGTSTRRTIKSAVSTGNLEVVKWLYDEFGECRFEGAFAEAARKGHLAVLRWLHEHDVSDSGEIMDAAAGKGFLEIVRWIHANRKGAFSTAAMDLAARNGHLDVVKWLHNNRQEGCTASAMSDAARNGFLDVVKWLHRHRSEGCRQFAMDEPGAFGHLEVVKWLHENRTEGCSRFAMNAAAANGHLEVVRWLHENRSEGCTAAAMNGAAKNGHLEVVKWLHENRSEGCTTDAMDDASCGHLETVQWLHRNRAEGFTLAAMRNAFTGGHFDVVLFLLSVSSGRFPIFRTCRGMNQSEPSEVCKGESQSLGRAPCSELATWLLHNYPKRAEVCVCMVLADDWYFMDWFRRMGWKPTYRRNGEVIWRNKSQTW
ncbi:hypothetical protein BBJ28_00001664 [Nothophytophthora sp. Chile5]|nr:hypothetical protein BBJ28_00001664 [Nothophytophthora sp. Chile5]